MMNMRVSGPIYMGENGYELWRVDFKTKKAPGCHGVDWVLDPGETIDSHYAKSVALFDGWELEDWTEEDAQKLYPQRGVENPKFRVWIEPFPEVTHATR